MHQATQDITQPIHQAFTEMDDSVMGGRWPPAYTCLGSHLDSLYAAHLRTWLCIAQAFCDAEEKSHTINAYTSADNRLTYVHGNWSAMPISEQSLSCSVF